MNELTLPALPNDDLDALLEILRVTAEAAPAEARALPGRCYTDPAFFALEKRALLEREWLPVAHVSQIPAPGDYLALDLLDEPLLVVRDKEGAVRVLSRVCQHRGMDMMPPAHVAASAGNMPALRCPYHLWTYDLGGKLLAAPEMQASACHARDDVRLPAFRCEVFQGFVCVNLDGRAAPLSTRCAGLAAHLAKWRLDEATLVWQREWDCAFNWKVLVENFMEPYHHMGAHGKTLQPLMPAMGCWAEDAGGDDWLAVHLPLNAQLREQLRSTGRPLPGFTPFPDLTLDDHHEWWVFLGQPLLLLFTAPDRAYWYRLLPTGAETCRLLTTLLVRPEAPAAPDYAAQLQQAEQEAIAFHLEDMAVCAGVQRGARSRAYVQGALSRLEAPIHRIQRYLARTLGA